jgi:pyrroline-5-carboxylate reductase
MTSMEDSGVKAAIVKAVQAAAHRGKEMGDEMGAAD